jgi:hypothetical protein
MRTVLSSNEYRNDLGKVASVIEIEEERLWHKSRKRTTVLEVTLDGGDSMRFESYAAAKMFLINNGFM